MKRGKQIRKDLGEWNIKRKMEELNVKEEVLGC